MGRSFKFCGKCEQPTIDGANCCNNEEEMNILEKLKQHLLSKKEDYEYQTTGWSNSETGTYWPGDWHCKVDFELLLEEIDKFSETFKDNE